MDLFHRPALTELSGFAEKPRETTFTIHSVYARTNGTEILHIPKPIHLTESEFRQGIDQWRNASGELQVPDDYQEWRRGLQTTRMLHPKPSDTAASLILLYIRPGPKDDDLKDMTFQTFKDVIAVFGIEFSFVHPLWRNTDVWHSVYRKNGKASFLLVIQKLYAVACAFSSEKRETNLIVFGHDATSDLKAWSKDYLQTNYNFYMPEWFDDTSWPTNPRLSRGLRLEQPTKPPMLEKLHPHHLYHPFSFAYMAFMDKVWSLEIRCDAQVTSIDELEEPKESAGRGLEHLVQSSQKARDSIAEMERLSRGLEVATMVLECMQKEQKWRGWSIPTRGTNPKSGSEEAVEWLAEAFPACRQRLKAQKVQLQWQDKRAKDITQMNFALISARETRSMRTLTIMSMVFLPATSIASLFDVPWERGNRSSQIKQGIVFAGLTLIAYVGVLATWLWMERDVAVDAKEQWRGWKKQWLSWMGKHLALNAKKRPLSDEV